MEAQHMATQQFAFAPITLLIVIVLLMLATIAALVVVAFRRSRSVAVPLVVGVSLAMLLGAGLLSTLFYARTTVTRETRLQHEIAIERAAAMHERELQLREMRGLLSIDRAIAPPLIHELADLPAAAPSLPIEAPRPASAEVSSVDSAFAPSPVADESPIETAAGSSPAWLTAATAPVSSGSTEERRLIAVSGQQFADAATAEKNALSEAARLVGADFEQARGLRSETWILGDGVKHAIRDRFTEEIQRTAGENQFTVYRSHLLIELSPQTRNLIEPIWRAQVSESRSFLVAGLLAGLTAFAGIICGYFRLDDRTGGRYRGRLRLATVGAIVLVGGTAFAGANVAAKFGSRYYSPEHFLPYEVPTPPTEPSAPVRPTPVPEPLAAPLQVTMSCNQGN